MDLINPLSVNPTEWSNTLKQFVGNLLTNFLSVSDHFVKLALTGLISAEAPLALIRFQNSEMRRLLMSSK